MIVPGAPNPLMYSGDPCEGYQIARALRFNSADSAYLYRTNVAPTDNTKWTYCARVKQSTQSPGTILAAKYSTNADELWLYQAAGLDSLKYYQLQDGVGGARGIIDGNMPLRDPSMFIDLVVAYDASLSGADRLKFYVNGAAFAATLLSTIAASIMNYNGAVQRIGRRTYETGTTYWSGYLADIHFIDGQALDPSAFGFSCPFSGQWRPKAYAGSYGANGWHLDFSDNSGTTAATLGADRSGNGNNFTPSGFSVAAGAGNDSLVDTPSNQFAVWNHLVVGDSAKSNGALDAAGTARATFDAGAGPSYWEVTANAASIVAGVVSDGGTTSTVSVPNGSTYGFRLSAGALDYTADGGSWTGIATGLTGVRFPYASGGSNTFNAGQRAFAYSRPSGYNMLCTKHLPRNGVVTLSGSFTGNANANGPFVFINGAPETLTINGNAVTFGTHADRLANGFKLRTSSASYNAAATNNWVATIKSPSLKSITKYQNAGGN